VLLDGLDGILMVDIVNTDLYSISIQWLQPLEVGRTYVCVVSIFDVQKIRSLLCVVRATEKNIDLFQ